MDFIVYASGEHKLLLIPNSILPPVVAQLLHGPLSVCGKIKATRGGEDLFQIFAADIDEHAFVAVGVEELELLLGHDHPFLGQYRKSTPRLRKVFGTSPIGGAVRDRIRFCPG